MSTTTTSKDLAPLYKAGRLALRDQSKTLPEVAASFLEPEPEHTPTKDMIPFPAVPTTPVLTDEAKAALVHLPEVFGKVIVTDRRALEPDEIAALYDERKTVKAVVEVLSGREAVINENVRTHVDVAAEEQGIAVPKDVVRGGHVVVEATPRDAQGHYIFAAPQQPTRVHIPGTNEDFSLEYRKGKDAGVEIDSNHLFDLVLEGRVTRAQYLALTREVRVFDEEKATKAVIKDESLLAVIAMVTKRVSPGKPGTNLNIRKAK